MAVLFAICEHYAKDPIIPLRLFKNRIFDLSNIIIMISAAAMFGSILYIPVFFQMVIGDSATSSGLVLLPLMFGIVFGSIVSGQIVSRTGKYRAVGLIGFSVATIGLFLLSHLTTSSSRGMVSLEMVVLGLGLGPSLPLLPLIIQNTFGPKDTSVVTGATQFFRTIGGAIGSSVLGTVFNNQLTSSLNNVPLTLPPSVPADKAAELSKALHDPNVIVSKDTLGHIFSSIPAQAMQFIKPAIDSFLALSKDSITYAISIVFTVSMALIAIALVLFYMVEETELRSSYDENAAKPSGAQPEAKPAVRA